MYVLFSQALLTSSLLIVSVYPNAAVDIDYGVLYTMRHRYVSQLLPKYTSSSSLLASPTLSVGTGRIFESVCFVCLSVCLSAA